MNYVHRAVWIMLYVDGTCIVSRPQTGVRQDDGSRREGLPGLHPNRLWQEEINHVHASTYYNTDDDTSRSARVCTHE